MHCVSPLHHHNPAVFPQFPVEHAIAGIDGIHAPGAALQETVRETAGAAAQISANEIVHVDGERAEGMFEFGAGAGREGHSWMIQWMGA